jgi:DNA-directed RNA polymerase subunit L
MQIVKISATEYEFIFEKSTSTIGKLLQKELLCNPDILYAAYSCPHPLETRMILKVTTHSKNPRDITLQSINNLVKRIDQL